MKILKFGGTSLGSAQRIKNAACLIDENSSCLVVLSAMSGITNELTDLYSELINGHFDEAKLKIDSINNHFNETAYQLFDDNTYLSLALTEINKAIQTLYKDLEIIKLKEVLAYGEQITSSLFSLYMHSNGRKNTLLDALTFMATDNEGEPDFSFIESKLGNQIKRSNEPATYITQGFICRDHKGRISNLKRGGSDYSATIIAAAIGAEEVCIWTDIDGLHNNDPRYVNDTKAITNLNFDEAAELAYFGAKILHPASIRPARDKNIPVLLKNTLNPDANGTRISEDIEVEGIKAIAAKDGILIIRIYSGRMLMAHGFLKRIFTVFDRYKIPVDVITTSEVAVSVTIEETNMIEALVKELEKLGSVEVVENCSIISAVGSEISLNPVVLSPLFECLSVIQPRMISLGGSRNNITVVVDSEKKSAALNQLNQSIFNSNHHEKVATQ
jgi:aspartate kinase